MGREQLKKNYVRGRENGEDEATKRLRVEQI